MMIKTLLVLSGAVLFAVPALHAQGGRYPGARPAAHGYYGGDRGNGRGGYRHGGHGHYYYYGGVPYFFPYVGLGFGYPAYAYGGWYGDGPYGYGYGYGPEGANAGAYEGRIANDGSDRNAPPSSGEGPSLPEAVQRQLSKKGYYKGSIDGQFGPKSRSALSQFQADHHLRETGRIDEATLDALGFTDRQ